MTRRTKLGNQIQKAIREGKTKLPADPFEGFRDKPEPLKIGGVGAVSQMTNDPEQAKLDRQRPPKGGFGQKREPDLVDKMAAEVKAQGEVKREPIRVGVPRSRKSLDLERQGVGVHPGTLASLGIPTYIDRRTPEMKAADAARMAAPDLDHLRRENATPATPPKANAEPAGGGFDDEKHPRHPAGSSQGGEFRSK